LALGGHGRGLCRLFLLPDHHAAYLAHRRAYAIWSGAGIVLISLVSWLVYKQRLDAAALAGMGLIIAGVVVINLFSKSAAH